MAYPRVLDQPFRFLDLRKEVRFIVYENLPRTISNATIDPLPYNYPPSQPTLSFTLIHRSTNTSILCVCKEIYDEAAPLVHKTIRDFILEASPKIAGGLDYYTHAGLLTPIFFKHLAEARKTTAKWDMSDLPFSPANVFLPGSMSRVLPSLRHDVVGEAAKRTTSTFITATSIQLLYHYIKRLSRPALSNPTIKFVRTWDREAIATRALILPLWEWCVRDFSMAFTVPSGDFRSKCYDFGVDIKLGGYVPTNKGQQPLLRENALITSPRYRNADKFVPDGVGRVVRRREPMMEKEWREEWLPNK
ncbi:hypothetical protein BKA58DRAFT_438059 [Alternaria rosae]|uniref:uncharacterized protein n=1 Tax=Alternaria rosae TaxID=1187941 RepID=UPI001E8E17DB|nr:uncharacterized protein BKA58DRAFT_438059 [Alternaria rosae]KAH6876110.1 hypothetical protein BKA58DRAFT_438059 [Alternaria rosae]